MTNSFKFFSIQATTAEPIEQPRSIGSALFIPFAAVVCLETKRFYIAIKTEFANWREIEKRIELPDVFCGSVSRLAKMDKR